MGALLVLWCSGCAGDYVARTKGVRDAYQSYRYDDALAQLPSGDKASPIDALLELFDRGMILHAAGRYEESIEVLARADKLSQELDFTSISEEAKTLVSSERERAYRGEDFEKLMITVLQALNYAQLGKEEDALVEVRRVNERIRKMINEEKKPYEQLAIARYLGGVLYEDQGDEDAAFIDYQDAVRLQPRLEYLADSILRLARSTERESAYRELKKKYPTADDSPLKPNEGQLVVIVEAGKAPEKVRDERRAGVGPEAQLIAVPIFKDRWAPARAQVTVGQQTRQAVTVTSLQQVAKVHLEDRVGKMVAKQLAGVAVKAGLAAGVGALAKNEGVGALAFVVMSAFNAPDLRSWLSLPAEFQVARFRLPAGPHSLRVETPGRVSEQSVAIRPKHITLVVLRRY